MKVLTLLTWATVGAAAAAAVILIWFLIARPKLTGQVKWMLLFGIGVFPIGAALTGNVVGFETTKKREFCNSCHVMHPWVDDTDDPTSTSLAAQHSRNDLFGDENCYTCHADYRMFGAVITKIVGLRHVYEYYVTGARELSEQEAGEQLHLYHPYPNQNCMKCHSTKTENWAEQFDHRGLAQEVRANAISCVSSGCHGPSHPVGAPDTKVGSIPEELQEVIDRAKAEADAGADAQAPGAEVDAGTEARDAAGGRR